MASSNVNLACIIDDDNIYVNLIKRIIETKNLCPKLLVFKDGQQSINYFEKLLSELKLSDIPEIIFLDINMPIMDGWEFLERFTKIRDKFKKEISLYVVSSSINPTDIDRAKSSPTVHDYLIKPLQIKELETIFSKKTA
ncbi:response regulator [Flavobacteriaceae bacterium MHTCC 0001]